jgi:hypothetical protein
MACSLKELTTRLRSVARSILVEEASSFHSKNMQHCLLANWLLWCFSRSFAILRLVVSNLHFNFDVSVNFKFLFEFPTTFPGACLQRTSLPRGEVMKKEQSEESFGRNHTISFA